MCAMLQSFPYNLENSLNSFFFPVLISVRFRFYVVIYFWKKKEAATEANTTFLETTIRHQRSILCVRNYVLLIIIKKVKLTSFGTIESFGINAAHSMYEVLMTPTKNTMKTPTTPQRLFFFF